MRQSDGTALMGAIHNRWAREDAVALAKTVLSGDVGAIEGCKQLADLAHSSVEDPHSDPDFGCCVALASDTDRLPTGSARQYWDQAALAREDRDIAEIEAQVREEVFSICRNIVARFGADEGDRGASA